MAHQSTLDPGPLVEAHFAEKVNASSRLIGLPLYVCDDQNPCGDPERLPGYCRSQIESSGPTCLQFHRDLSALARQQSQTVVSRCPAGLTCVGLATRDGQVGGGHLWLEDQGESPADVARISQTRLEEIVAALPAVVGRPEVRHGGETRVASLLSHRQPLERALANLCQLLVKNSVCDYAVLGSWVASQFRWGCSYELAEAEGLERLADKALQGKAHKQYTRAQLKRMSLQGSCGLMLPLGEVDLQGLLLLSWNDTGSLKTFVADPQLTAGLLLAVESATLIEQAAQETRELEQGKRYAAIRVAQVGAALSTALNLPELLRLILQSFVRLTEVDGARITMVGQRSDQAACSWGRQEGDTTLHLPLSRHDQVKAHLTLVAADSRRFDPEEVGLLETFAQQAAMAIENAEVFEDEQERAREATALFQAARAIEEGQDLDDVLEHSARALAELAECNRCLILLKDHQKPQFAVVAATGLSGDQEEFFGAFRLHVTQLSEQLRSELQEGRQVLFDTGVPEESGLGGLCSLLPSSSGLLVPLLVKERLIGLIYLDDSRGAHHFSPSRTRMVMTLALQVGNAIQRASLINQLQENLGPLKALYHVSTAITGTLSLSKVVRLIVDQAVELLEHSACGLLVLDEMGEGFRLETSVGLSGDMLEPALQARMARVAVERKRAVALYLDKDEEGEELRDTLEPAGFGGLLSVPLIARKKMVGVLNCFVPQGIRFRQQEIRFLRGFANQAAIAVENARLHGMIRFKMGELGTLFEVSKAVTSTLQLDRVLEEIVRHVREILRADACSLMLLEGMNLVLKTAEGLEPGGSRPIAMGRGVAGIAAKTGQPMILLDRDDAVGEFPESIRGQGLKTILSVPIETRGRVIGLINVYYRDFISHTPAQINLLTALGSQAAVAIENARLYADKERVTELLRSVLIPRERLEFPPLIVGHRFIPSMDLSGDYYDLIPLGPKRCALVIADVSGKGPDAAIQTVRAKHVLKSYALAGYSPAKSLQMLNSQIGSDGETRQVTVFYAEADLADRKLRYACAGHEPAIFWRAGEPEPGLLTADGILIGAIADAEYEDCQVDIPEGSWLLLYTDGITEARSPDGRFFGLNRVLEVMREHQGNSAQRLVNGLYTRVRKFTREKITDDFSVLAVRF